MKLQFNSTTWQNRPSRIYLNGEGISNKTMDLLVSRHLIFSPTKEEMININVNNRNVPIFSFLDENFFELQVWNKKNDGQSNEVNNAPIWFEKMSFSKDNLYCTINCKKGLKVQDMYLVGILRIGNTLHISEKTSFPLSSSKRRSIIEKEFKSHPYRRSKRQKNG